jgi:hypothetical protein
VLAYTRFAFLLASVGLCFPEAALAWTDVQLTAASTTVDVRQPGLARAALDLSLQVRSGKLSRFELPDLAAGLELPTDTAARFVGTDGRAYVAQVAVLDANGLELTFPDRRNAPGRGDYELHVELVTRASITHTSIDNPATVMTWSLPAWPNRVPNARIEILAPKGTIAAPVPGHEHDTQADAVELSTEGDATRISFTRMELPRTEVFTVAVQLPRPSAPPPAARLPFAPKPTAIWLGLGLALLWLLKHGLRPRVCLSVLAQAAAVVLFEKLPLLAAALGLLGLLLVAEPPVHTGAAAPPRWLATWLDATTAPGASSALLACALLAWLWPRDHAAVSCTACLCAALLLNGSRHARAERLAQALAAQPLESKRTAPTDVATVRPALRRSTSAAPPSALRMIEHPANAAGKVTR